MAWVIKGMIYLGSALMVYNIWGFIRFARSVRSQVNWEYGYGILHLPIALLIMFLLGYLGVGFFVEPNLLVSAILFGGSVFVFVMYRLLSGVTRRIMESQKLEARLLAVEEANRAKTSFLSGISHEMRTPMNVIIGLDNIALKDPTLQSETRKHLERIRLSAWHLLGLINNMLDMNRLTSGALELRTEPFSLTQALDQVLAITHTLCNDKGLVLKADLSDDIRGGYVGDAMQLKQILLAILDNAVKYTDAPGTVGFTAACVGESEGVRTLRFSVSDTGVGIDSGYLSRVFDVFSQEDASSTNRFGGSGLSLAVTKRTVELMSGTIEAQSQKNVGSTFTVTVPLPLSDEPEAQPEPEPVSLEGRHILIVEDLAENAEIVQDLLELEGVETDWAENGQLGLDRFCASAPGAYDAILMDLRMPVMDGLEATRRIRALSRPDAKTIPIIALTANAFESDVRASLEAGMTEHLAKPADADMLYSTLRHLIQARPAEGGAV